MQPEPGAEPTGHRRIRVLLADDHRIVRDGLAGLLVRQPDLDSIGVAEDGQQASKRRVNPK